MTSVVNDTLKGTTLGDPDGAARFVESLGCEVPTYINPRKDLISPHHGRDKAFKRVDYHIPFRMRGDFKPDDWPVGFYEKIRASVRTDMTGFVLCSGITVEGEICKRRAVNRTMFCASHGGSLHPADKKMSGMTLAPMPQDRIDRLDRVQKFMQGFIEASDLDDDEIQGGFVRNDNGFPVKGIKLGAKFQSALSKELHIRLNDFLQSETPDMLKVMIEIAKNDLYEAGDRIKAAIWVTERVMGKTPEVLIHGKAERPYETILDHLESGSREDHRRKIESRRPTVGKDGEDDDIVEAEVEGFTDDLPGSDHLDDERAGQSYSESESESFSSSQSSQESESEPDGSCDRGDGGDGENTGTTGTMGVGDDSIDDGAWKYSATIEQQRKEKMEAAKRIRKAKQRRYAARAMGATSLHAVPWLIEFQPIREEGILTGHAMKLWPPDRQTPALVARLMGRRYVDRQHQADEIEAEALRLQEKLEALEKKKIEILNRNGVGHGEQHSQPEQQGCQASDEENVRREKYRDQTDTADR